MAFPRARRVAPGVLMLLCLLGVLVPSPSLANQPGSGMDIQIKVLPPGDASIAPSPAPAPLDARDEGTVSAVLVSDDAGSRGGEQVQFDLVVSDARDTPRGWSVTIGEPSPPAHPLVLNRYLSRATSIDGGPEAGPQAPRGVRLSIAQPLDRKTTLFIAAPGTGAGSWGVRFALASETPDSPVLRSMIVTLTIAP